MSRFAIFFMVGFMAMPSMAFADDHMLNKEVFAAYAAMSKLEANKAEAAGAVMLAAIPGLPDNVRSEAAEDYAGDLDQMAGYISTLRDMDLTEEQSDALDAFSKQWESASAEGTTLITEVEDTEEYRKQVFAWWESLDDLDDLIDDVLEGILETNGIALE